MTKAQEVNGLYYNQAVCVPIESENAKCHPDLGDGRRSYKDNGYMVFERNGQWYFVPEADSMGNNRTLNRETMNTLIGIFGWDNILQVRDLPQEEI